MAGYRNRRFTIYDAMEAKGIFAENTANIDARSDETGQSTYEKQDFPKMFYSPAGERRIIVPATYIDTPFGPKKTDEQTELVYKLAKDLTEEKKLRADGWHDHPAKAIAASGGEAPAVSADERMKELEAQIAQLQAEKADAAAKVLQPSSRVTTSKVG